MISSKNFNPTLNADKNDNPNCIYSYVPKQKKRAVFHYNIHLILI